MARRKRPPPSGGSRYGVVDPAIGADVSPTTEGSRRNGSESRNERFERIDPPFRGAREETSVVTHREFSLGAKVAAGVGGFFITVVVPAIWFLSGMNSNVSRLLDDVKDVKKTTEQLGEESKRQGQRLISVEKKVDEISSDRSATKIDIGSGQGRSVPPATR